MPRKDDEAIGLAADVAARVRLGRRRGLALLASSRLFEAVVEEVVEMAGVREDDNVVLLGSDDLRLIPRISPTCRQIVVVDDRSDDDLSAMESKQRDAGRENVKFQWGRASQIPTPQYTTDRIISLNYVYRSRHPFPVVRQMHTTSRHGSTVVCCEPSSSLDLRTARKYSREAGLSMDDHRALVAYARSAVAHRGFTREGIKGLMASVGIQDVEVRELLHGLVLAARGSVRY
jgi:hypothetical protein